MDTTIIFYDYWLSEAYARRKPRGYIGTREGRCYRSTGLALVLAGNYELDLGTYF